MCSRARRHVDAIDPTWSPPSRAKANRRAPTRTRSKTNAPTRRGRTSASCASFSCRTICHTNSRSRCSRSSASRRPRSSSSLPTRTRARHHASGANTEGISGRAGLSRRLGYGRLPHTNQPPLSESRRTARLRRSACAGAAAAALYRLSSVARQWSIHRRARALYVSCARVCVHTTRDARTGTHARTCANAQIRRRACTTARSHPQAQIRTQHVRAQTRMRTLERARARTHACCLLYIHPHHAHPRNRREEA
jgi:hypothetical protein